MRILQITSTPIWYPGGMERVIFEISKRLSKKNKVTVLQTNLYENKPLEKVSKTEKDNVKIITCKNDNFLFGYGYSKEFKKELKKIYQDYDIIHIHGCGRFTTDYSLKFLKNKKPIVFTSHGFFHSSKSKIFKILDEIILRRRFKAVKFANALTEAEIPEYGRLGISKERIIIIPNGIDLKKFKKNEKNIEKLKKKYNLKKNIILYVGRIHESKGLQYLLKAVKKIDCKVLLVGRDAGYTSKLKELAEKLNIKNKIIFTGSVSENELIASYFLSDLFVLPSKHEGFGIVVIEAMACGLPCIVSDRGSLPYIVKSGKNGYVINYGNSEELRVRIIKLLEIRKLREEMGKINKRKVEKYKWDLIVEKYQKLYNRALWK